MLITSAVKSRDFFTNKVYLQVKGEEKARVNISTGKSTHTETKKFTSYRSFENVAEGAGLLADTVYEWEYIFRIPSNALPTYIGKNATHKWHVRAGLDVTGKDPVSKWHEFLFFQTLPSAPERF